ncbi:MT-A70-domain-containing protein [Dipodascopsis tothii]|uniref:MT-A70-domain-containing protein n=1 Tax=Dipodascopsis tothii TaxID=44089 RepID=UPI0034CF0CEA
MKTLGILTDTDDDTQTEDTNQYVAHDSDDSRGSGDADAIATDELANHTNDLSNHYYFTGQYPQAIVRNAEDRFSGYPKLRKLVELKRAHMIQNACPPFIQWCQPVNMPALLEMWMQSRVKFDVIMVGSTTTPCPSFSTLNSLPIQKFGLKPSFVFLWLPSSALELGRAVLNNWGYRRAEDIVYAVRSPNSVRAPPGMNSDEIFRKTTWHCLMGIRGTVRRSVDTNVIHCNIDTDVIIEHGNSLAAVPETIYTVIENFALSNRRLHIIPNYLPKTSYVSGRPGWTIVSPDVIGSNFSVEQYFAYTKRFGDRLQENLDIENLRPKSPVKRDYGRYSK